MLASKLGSAFSQDAGGEGGKEADGDILGRLVEHRLRMVDPGMAAKLRVCKDWQPAHGVPPKVSESVRTLIHSVEGSTAAPVSAQKAASTRLSCNEAKRRQRESVAAKAAAGPGPQPQFSARTAEQNEEAVDLFRSFVLAKLCDYFHVVVGSSYNAGNLHRKQNAPPDAPRSKDQAGSKGMVTLEYWKHVLQNVSLLNWTCSRPKGLPCEQGFRKFCEERNIVDMLAHMLPLSPHESCACVLPVLLALKTFVCGHPGSYDDYESRLQGATELTAANFFGTLNEHLGPWTASALDLRNGCQEADMLLGCVGDLVRELLRHQSGCEAAESADFVPALHKVICTRLLTEPLLWPRACMLLMDSIEAMPKADYVQCGLDLSKALRRMHSTVPTSDVSAIPSLLVLRLGDLRRARQSTDRRQLLKQRLAPRASSCQGHRRRPPTSESVGVKSEGNTSSPRTPSKALTPLTGRSRDLPSHRGPPRSSSAMR